MTTPDAPSTDPMTLRANDEGRRRGSTAIAQDLGADQIPPAHALRGMPDATA